jgi:hypothetical protein
MPTSHALSITISPWRVVLWLVMVLAGAAAVLYRRRRDRLRDRPAPPGMARAGSIAPLEPGLLRTVVAFDLSADLDALRAAIRHQVNPFDSPPRWSPACTCTTRSPTR